MERKSTIEQIKSLNASIETLRQNGLDIPATLIKQVKMREEDYINNEVIPAVEEYLSKLMDGISTPLSMSFKVGSTGVSTRGRKPKNEKDSYIVSEPIVDDSQDNADVTSISAEEPRVKKHQHQNYSQYSLNGGEFLNKVGFVVAFVEAILDYDPDCTFKDLVELLPMNSSNNRTILSLDDWAKKNDDAKKRYYTKKRLHTADGIEFFVSTQWTKESFDKKLLPAVEGIGFSWEEKEG